MNDIKEKKSETVTAKEAVFSKSQLISSKRYADKKDALSVLLSDDKTYSVSETDRILNDFLKGKVK